MVRGIVECEAGPTAQLGLDMDPGGVRTGFNAVSQALCSLCLPSGSSGLALSSLSF